MTLCKYYSIDIQSDIEDFEDSDSDQNNASSTKYIQTNLNNDNKNNSTITNSPIEGFSDDDEMDGIADDIFFNKQQQPIQKINLANFRALEGLKNWNIEQSSLDDDMEDDLEKDVYDQPNENGKKMDVNKASYLDFIFSDEDDNEIIDINNNNNNNANVNVNKNVNNNMKDTQHDQSKKNTTINSQSLSDIISDSQSTFDEENTSLENFNNDNHNNNSNNSNKGFQILSFMDKKKIPIKRQPIISIDKQKQQNKKNVYNQPTFSLANNNKSDTLIELKNFTNNYHIHTFKK